MDNFRGNQRKKASIRFERSKQDIPQFKKWQPIYEKYLEKGKEIEKLKSKETFYSGLLKGEKKSLKSKNPD